MVTFHSYVKLPEGTPLKLDIERRLASSMRKGKVFWLQVNELTAFHPP
jgi:hypothetical protein